MGGGANAAFAWDGVYGHTYTLDYLTAVPLGDASGFGGVGYTLHLTGVVTAAPVPEASTYGMMLAGLGLVGFMARRRTRA
jgi:predicted ABC-type sugar transport system permease subunit